MSSRIRSSRPVVAALSGALLLTTTLGTSAALTTALASSAVAAVPTVRVGPIPPAQTGSSSTARDEAPGPGSRRPALAPAGVWTAASAAPAREPYQHSTTAARPSAIASRVTIRRYADAPGSQRTIDACQLVLWTSNPFWLAGHNYCGFQWLARVRTGTEVVVTTGRAAGRYLVTGHLRLARQHGGLPAVHADLVLQTCVGSGTGLTLARRLR